MEKSENMFGMRVLRKFKGPASHLISLQDPQNRHFVGIVFYERYRNHPTITDSLDGLMEFLQCPVAKGITPLYTHDPVKAGFVYETGKSKSVAEMIRQASDLGLKPGPRAGLQLIVDVAEILRGAVRIAEEYAIYSHGGLTPWRIMVRPDGKLQVIGFAIPQVEVLDFSRNPNNLPSEDSFRYVPPERMSSDIEDISSDLFSLALIGFETMTTRPVYDGSASIIQESASRADVSLKLNQALMEGILDRNTHDFLDRALRLHGEDRFRSVDEMIREGRRLLGFSQLRGMSLFELVGKTDIQSSIGGSQEIEAMDEATGMFDRSALQVDEKEKIEKLTTKIKQEAPSPPPVEKIAPERIPEASNMGTGNSPKDLLRLLRESQINIPAADSPKPSIFQQERPTSRPQKIEEKPLPSPKIQDPNAALLSALRTSMSSSAKVIPERETAKPERTSPERKSTTTSKTSAKSSALSSLISKPERSSTLPRPSISKSTEPKKDTRQQASKDLKDSLLKSLVSKPANRTQSEKNPFEHLPIGERLHEDLEDELDEAATSIITHPALEQFKKETKEEPPIIKTAQKISLKPEEKQSKKPQKTKKETVSLAEKQSGKQTVKHVVKPIEVAPSSKIESSVSKTGQQLGDIYGVPVAQKSSFPSNKGERFVFSLGEGMGSIKQSLHPKVTSASVIYLMLLHRLLPVRTDLTGSITSMYRLSQDGKPVSGLEQMKQFHPKQPILLCSVPNTIQLLTFEVWKEEELVRFTAPVGLAVPVSSLLDHLVSWLRLEKSSWQISVGDIVLGPQNILFDVQKQLGTETICLKQKRGIG